MINICGIAWKYSWFIQCIEMIDPKLILFFNNKKKTSSVCKSISAIVTSIK